MNRLFYSKLFLLLFVISSNTASAQTPRLEIHHIGVGDGDATLIIGIDTTGTGFVDTVTVLIDGQRSSGPGNAIWNYVRDTLNALCPTRKKLDFVILSHLHIDHYGGMITVLTNLRQAGWGIDYIIDREGNGVKPGLTWSIDSIYKYECVDEVISFPTYTSTANRYVNIANNYTRVSVLPGVDVFSPKNFKHLSMVCLASMGAALTTTMPYYAMFLRKGSGNQYVPYNENDLSMVFNVGLGVFNYFTGGDIGGGSPYADGETPIGNYLYKRFNLLFHYCAIKTSHHGSAHSTNDNFLTDVTPTLAVIPANLRTYSGTALPTQETIELLEQYGVAIRYCFQPQDTATKSNFWTAGKLQYLQDVCIKVKGLPLAGNAIPMELITRRRSRLNLAFIIEPPNVSVMNCSKGHSCSFK